MSRSLNGTTDVINQLASPITAYPMTFSGWFNKTALLIASAITEIDTNGANSGVNLLYVDTGGNLLTLSVDAPGTGAQATKGTYTAGSWFHGVASYSNAASRTSYLNGVAGAPDLANIPIAAFTRVSIGRIFDGMLAEVGMWDVLLTQDEITSLSKGFSPKLIRPQSLKVYVPLVRELNNYCGAIMTASGTTPADHPRIFY